MRLSLNEVEGGCLKAARGAGLPYGLAQEAGRAARWLALSGLPWCGPLLAALEAFEAQDQERTGLSLMSDAARLTGGPSALLLGPAAADVWRAGLMEDRPLVMEAPDQPLFCLAALALGVAEGAAPLVARWDGGSLGLGREGSSLLGALPEAGSALDIQPLDRDADAAGGRDLLSAAPGCLETGCPADPDCWAALASYAARTLVPESPESQAGAGAGAIDND